MKWPTKRTIRITATVTPTMTPREAVLTLSALFWSAAELGGVRTFKERKWVFAFKTIQWNKWIKLQELCQLSQLTTESVKWKNRQKQNSQHVRACHKVIVIYHKGKQTKGHLKRYSRHYHLSTNHEIWNKHNPFSDLLTNISKCRTRYQQFKAIFLDNAGEKILQNTWNVSL